MTVKGTPVGTRFTKYRKRVNDEIKYQLISCNIHPLTIPRDKYMYAKWINCLYISSNTKFEIKCPISKLYDLLSMYPSVILRYQHWSCKHLKKSMLLKYVYINVSINHKPIRLAKSIPLLVMPYQLQGSKETDLVVSRIFQPRPQEKLTYVIDIYSYFCISFFCH